MIERYIELDLDDAGPGMILFETIFDAHGSVLLPEGATLTESMLTSLRRRGIDRLLIVNDAVSEAELAAERERVEERLAQLFRKCSHAGESDLLLNSVLQYRLGTGA